MKDYQLRKVNGFTLLELLVALVLIGIILSFATLSLDSGEDKKIKEEAYRFYNLVKLAQEESILNDRVYILHISSESYHFTVETPDGEVALTDPVFRSRQFAEFIKPVISVEQLQFNVKADEEEKKDSDFKVAIYPSGELFPLLKIEFPASDKSYEIIGSLQGTVELQTREQEL